jgi:hypothetical protein
MAQGDFEREREKINKNSEVARVDSSGTRFTKRK